MAEKDIESAKQFVKDLNDRWVKGKSSTLGELFHKDMVIINSQLDTVGKGAEACIDSYAQFCSHGRILKFEVEKMDVRLFGETASVAVNFEIEYSMLGKVSNEKGKEVFVLQKSGDSWKAVMRFIRFLSD